jgi:hypothetical protein
MLQQRSMTALPSALALVAANLVPIYGVLFLGWRIFPLLALFWMETIVVGAFYVLRILLATPGQGRWWNRNLPTALYFCLPYGAFAMLLGLLLFALFGDTGMSAPQLTWELPRLALELLLMESFRYSLYALAGSQLFSFLWDYLGQGEFRRWTPEQVANQPYGRHAVLLAALFVGVFPAWLLNYPLWALVLLIVLKSVGDLYNLFKGRARPV